MGAWTWGWGGSAHGAALLFQVVKVLGISADGRATLYQKALNRTFQKVEFYAV